jgi:hypothetical protein
MKSQGASDALARTVAVNAITIGQVFYLLNSRYLLDSSASITAHAGNKVSAAWHRRGGNLAAALYLRSAASSAVRQQAHSALGLALAVSRGPFVFPRRRGGEADHPLDGELALHCHDSRGRDVSGLPSF